VIEDPLQLECFEYRRRLAGGRTLPLLAAAMDNDGREYQVVLKLRHPEARDGHFGPTSLACELVCAMLARAVGLPVPEYAIVRIPPELPQAIPDESIRRLLSRNVGENFGSAYREGYALWDPDYRPRSTEVLEALEEVLTFDATVINGDRKREKPNLLWRGDNLLMIDHSLALPMHLWSEDVERSPLFPDDEITQHCTFRALTGTARTFSTLLPLWASDISPADILRLRASIPADWETQPGDLDRVFRFIEERPPRFDDIAARLLGAVG